MRDDIESAYHIAEGQCLDAMYELRRFNGSEAIECLKRAIRSVEEGRRRADRKRRIEMARIPARAPIAVPPSPEDF